MKDEFDLTILTPCQAGGAKLVRTVRSINSAVETGLRIQHIILHNLASPLNLNEFQSDDRWREIDAAPDCGPYDALNRGLKRARGRYVQVLNAGDVIVSVHTLKKACQKSADIVSCSALDEFGAAIPSISRLEKLAQDSVGRHEATLIRREIIAKNPFDLSFAIKADRNQLISIIAQGHVVHCTEEPLVMVEATGFSSARIISKELENLRVSLRHAGHHSVIVTAIFLFAARVSALSAIRLAGVRRQTGRRIAAILCGLFTFRQMPARRPRTLG